MSFAALTVAEPLVVDLVDGGVYDTDLGHTYLKGDPANTPVKARVLLYAQRSGRAFRETWSEASTGAYQFTGLRAGTFFVVAFDSSGLYGGEAETDIVLPTPP